MTDWDCHRNENVLNIVKKNPLYWKRTVNMIKNTLYN